MAHGGATVFKLSLLFAIHPSKTMCTIHLTGVAKIENSVNPTKQRKLDNEYRFF